MILSYRRGTADERLLLEAVDRGEPFATIAALAKAIGLMTRHGAIADTIGRARHFGEIARDALAPLAGNAPEGGPPDVIDFCISRVA